MARRATHLNEALSAAMRARGWRPADLARATGISPKTISAILAGSTSTPQLAQRDALDDVLAPGVPGVTLDICEQRRTNYPGVERAEVARLAANVAAQLPDEVATAVSVVLTWALGELASADAA